jgi:hypothetical protein
MTTRASGAFDFEVRRAPLLRRLDQPGRSGQCSSGRAGAA